MVLCCARWKLLYRYTQNKSALCCSPPLSPQQRHSLSLSFSLFLPLISLHSACLFTSVSPHIQYICYSCSYFFSLILFPFSLSFSLLYVIFVCFLPLVISLPPACFKNPSQTQFATRSMLNPKGNKYQCIKQHARLCSHSFTHETKDKEGVWISQCFLPNLTRLVYGFHLECS